MKPVLCRNCRKTIATATDAAIKVEGIIVNRVVGKCFYCDAPVSLHVGECFVPASIPLTADTATGLDTSNRK